MCLLTANSAVTEAIVRYHDGTMYVAYERACGCVGLRPVRIADLERLPLVEGQLDTMAGGEDEIVALPAPAPLPLAA